MGIKKIMGGVPQGHSVNSVDETKMQVKNSKAMHHLNNVSIFKMQRHKLELQPR